jgi:hypothetical protein
MHVHGPHDHAVEHRAGSGDQLAARVAGEMWISTLFTH